MPISWIFFVLTIFSVPFLPSGATIPRWAFLSLVCAGLLFKIKPTGPMLLLIGYMTVMSAMAPVWYDAAFLFWHFLLLAVLFAYAKNVTDLHSVTTGLCLGLWVNSAVVIAQVFGWQAWPQEAHLDGLFFRHTFASEACAMAIVLAAGYRLWWLVPGLLPTLLLGSRTPLLAVGVAGMVMFWPRQWRYGASPFVALLIPIVAAAVVFHGAGNHNFWVSTEDRLGVWIDTVQGLSVLEHGLGSFMPDFPALQHHSEPLFIRYQNTHNDMLQVIYELGIGGAVLIGLLFWRMAQVERGPEWYALAVFMLEGFFSFPLYEPVTGAVAACCAGWIFSDRRAVRGLLDRCGLRIQDWHGHAPDQPFSAGGAAVPVDAFASLGGSLCGDGSGRSGLEHWHHPAGDPRRPEWRRPVVRAGKNAVEGGGQSRI
jgi:hypothetical protein